MVVMVPSLDGPCVYQSIMDFDRIEAEPQKLKTEEPPAVRIKVGRIKGFACQISEIIPLEV
jgi:hypothetical protein